MILGVAFVCRVGVVVLWCIRDWALDLQGPEFQGAGCCVCVCMSMCVRKVLASSDHRSCPWPFREASSRQGTPNPSHGP